MSSFETLKNRRDVTWMSIVGTRPQFVKLAPLCRAIEVHNGQCGSHRIQHRIVHTGQHYDPELAAFFFTQLKIPCPDHNLEAGSGSPGAQLARMIDRLEPILLSEKPNWLINYGDTNSTLAGVLAGARTGARLAHVEAGCRSGDIGMPEEQARIVADHLSCLLLAPSKSAEANLRREGIGTADDPRDRRVAIVGDLMYDALIQCGKIAEAMAGRVLREFDIQHQNYLLLTLHRAENTDRVDRLRAIVEAAESLGFPVVFPVHPRTRNVLASAGISLNGQIRVSAPLGYLEMLALQRHARKILTDSGGVQREAFYLGVPCVTLRENTEWPETVELGANRIAGACPERIRAAVITNYEPVQARTAPYGDGRAAYKIVRELQDSGTDESHRKKAGVEPAARSRGVTRGN